MTDHIKTADAFSLLPGAGSEGGLAGATMRDPFEHRSGWANDTSGGSWRSAELRTARSGATSVSTRPRPRRGSNSAVWTPNDRWSSAVVPGRQLGAASSLTSNEEWGVQTDELSLEQHRAWSRGTCFDESCQEDRRSFESEDFRLPERSVSLHQYVSRSISTMTFQRDSTAEGWCRGRLPGFGRFDLRGRSTCHTVVWPQ